MLAKCIIYQKPRSIIFVSRIPDNIDMDSRNKRKNCICDFYVEACALSKISAFVSPPISEEHPDACWSQAI